MPIKASSIHCPNCNAPLNTEGHEGKMYCPFCGAEILLEDDSVKTVNYNVNTNIHYTKTDEARIKEAETKKSVETVRLDAAKMIILLFGILAILMFVRDFIHG